MSSLIAFTFPEMGQGILAVVILGAALLAMFGIYAMMHSVLQLMQARVARRPIVPAPTAKDVAFGEGARVHVPVR